MKGKNFYRNELTENKDKNTTKNKRSKKTCLNLVSIVVLYDVRFCWSNVETYPIHQEVICYEPVSTESSVLQPEAQRITSWRSFFWRAAVGKSSTCTAKEKLLFKDKSACDFILWWLVHMPTPAVVLKTDND